MVYAKSKKAFFAKELGIERIPSKAAFGRVLSAVDSKEIGDAILNLLRTRFGSAGNVVAVDGTAICSTSLGGEGKTVTADAIAPIKLCVNDKK